MSELKPCPCCGGELNFSWEGFEAVQIERYIQWWQATCDCGYCFKVFDASEEEARVKMDYRIDTSNKILITLLKECQERYIQISHEKQMLDHEILTEILTKKQVREVLGLLDGAYDLVFMHDAETLGQRIWKENWLERARKYGCSLD